MVNGENFALDWIEGELEVTLEEARAALATYAEEGREEAQLRACVAALHQVHGTLRMLELDGVLLMAEQMEQTAAALLNGSIKDAPRAEQVLMQTLLQLPLYLEEVKNGLVEDMPLVLSDVNDLRECGGLSSLQLTPSISEEFSEDDAKRVVERYTAIDGAAKTNKIRGVFQSVLLNVLKGEVTPKTTVTLVKVGAGLEKICEGSPLTTLWKSLQFFSAGYKDAPEKMSLDAVSDLRRVDAEIKRLATDGAEALVVPPPVELIRDLLRTAEALGQNSEEISALRSAVQTPQSHNTTPRDALEHAAVALREELSAVRDEFDLYVRAEEQSLKKLSELTEPLDQIAGTCGMLGYDDMRSQLQERRAQIAALKSDSDITEDLLISLASSLISVDVEFNESTGVTSSEEEAVGKLGEAQLLSLIHI